MVIKRHDLRERALVLFSMGKYESRREATAMARQQIERETAARALANERKESAYPLGQRPPENIPELDEIPF